MPPKNEKKGCALAYPLLIGCVGTIGPTTLLANIDARSSPNEILPKMRARRRLDAYEFWSWTRTLTMLAVGFISGNLLRPDFHFPPQTLSDLAIPLLIYFTLDAIGTSIFKRRYTWEK